MFKFNDYTRKHVSDIELMRFLASFMIMSFHFGGAFNRGSILVEFFFILTGILMAQSATRLLQSRKEIDVGIETKKFILKKIKSFLPYFVVVAAFYPLFSLATNGFYSIKKAV